MIIRNSSNVRVNETIWTHQRDATPKIGWGGLDSLGVRTRYARSQEVYKECSPVECWYRVEFGAARRFSTRADGKRQIVDLLLPADVFVTGTPNVTCQMPDPSCASTPRTISAIDGSTSTSRVPLAVFTFGRMSGCASIPRASPMTGMVVARTMPFVAIDACVSCVS